MTLKEFLANYSSGYDHDGAYGEQCVDWFRGYCSKVLEIGQPAGVKGAYQFWDNRDTDTILKNNFTPIANAATNCPQYGDVVIWKKALNGEFGHVAICIDTAATANKFISSDQNWNGQSTSKNKDSTNPTVVTHNYNYVAGWLRPKDQNKISGNSPSNNGKATMQVDEATYSMLVGKATKYDEFTKAGFEAAANVQKTIEDLQATIKNRDETISQQAAKLQECEKSESITVIKPVEVEGLQSCYSLDGHLWELDTIIKDSATTNTVGHYKIKG